MIIKSQRIILAIAFAIAAVSANAEEAQRPTANFTGPLLTPGAKTASAGSASVEPYLIFNSATSLYDGHGRRQTKEPASEQWQLVAPFSYGITDRLQGNLTAGVAHASSGSERSDGARVTDTKLGLQYMLKAPNNDGTQPAISVALTHRFPTGDYDRLDANPLNGTGNGASVNTANLFSQHYVWLPNGRPLRWRANVAYSPSPDRITVRGVSVYGTPADFRGHVRLGDSVGLSTSVEYSIDEHWALALDVAYDRYSSSRLVGVQRSGTEIVESINRLDPARSVYSLAPALQYNFSDRVGLIAGVHFSVAGKHNDAFVAPQVAVNIAF